MTADVTGACGESPPRERPPRMRRAPGQPETSVRGVRAFFYLEEDEAMERLQETVGKIAGEIRGRMGVCVRDVKTGEEIGFQADEALPMASVCKVPILVAAYREHEAGRVDLGARVTFTEECRCFGSGLFNAFDPGLQPTWHDLLLMMIVVSDNAATDLVLDRLTPKRATATMRDLGLANIRIDRPIR